MENLPLGKLPPNLLEKLLKKLPKLDSKVVLGPGTGLDCSVVDIGNQYLVLKSDPISLTTGNIGWYAVEINVNDIVTTGADPKWMLTTILLPQGKSNYHDLDKLVSQLIESASNYGITIIGGHTEITSGVSRPIISSTMIGTVEKEKLITPKGVQSGDLIFLTKEIAIETVAILAQEFTDQLKLVLTNKEIKIAKSYIQNPGISIFSEATLLRESFGVSAMHDPTEGGLAAALWEMSYASQKIFNISINKIPISDLTKKITKHFSINPINSISSGSLLFTANPKFENEIFSTMKAESIPLSKIGEVGIDGTGVFITDQGSKKELIRPERDEISKII